MGALSERPDRLPPLAGAWTHMRVLWPRRTVLPPAPFVLWGFYCFAIGERRWEVALLMILPAVLAYGSEQSKALLVGTYPLVLVALFYDAMRFVQNFGLSAARIHACDLRDLDARLFGVGAGAARVSLPDFFQAHESLGLDLYCAVPYGIFIYVAVLYAVSLSRRDPPALLRFSSAFLLLNVAAFATYHIYPAAPPWYVHAHGCVADLGVRASEGAKLARVDALLGIRYFAGFYGRSHDVFGAVPSLHVAYPLLILLQGWRRHRLAGRALSALYFVSMAFAAVYLDHHWVLDVLLGAAYTAAISVAVTVCFARRERASARSIEPSPPAAACSASPPTSGRALAGWTVPRSP